MKRLRYFSQNWIFESSEVPKDYSLVQIEEALDNIEEDFKYILQVKTPDDESIYLDCTVTYSNADISAEIPDDLSDYEYDYDRDDLVKMFRSAFKEIKNQDRLGPKFTFEKIIETAEELLISPVNYVEDIDTSELEVKMKPIFFASRSNKIEIEAEFKSGGYVSVSGMNTDKFKKDMLDKLVSGIVDNMI